MREGRKIRRLINWILIMMLITANIIAGSGCSNMYSEKSIQSKGLKHLKKKYGNDVEYTIKSAGPGLSSYDMYITVTGKEEWDVRLSWYPERKAFYDNYMSWVLQDEVEAVYLPLIHRVYEGCKAFNAPYGGQMSKLYTKDTTIDDYLKTVIVSDFNVFLASDSFDCEEKLKQLITLMKENQLDIKVTVLYVPEEMMDEINRDNHRDIISRGQYLLWGGYIKTKDGEDRFRDWREGKLK